MSSPAKPSPPGTAFPFLGVALFILLLEVVSIALLPPDPYRSAVTIAALFATGYCALALIVGKSVRLSRAEVLAFTVGLTIVITSLSALLVSILGFPITDNAITILGLPIAVAAWYLRRSHEAPGAAFARGARTVFDFSEYSRFEKVIAGGLMAGIVVALIAFILLSAVFSPDVLSPGLAIVGPDGTPASLPTSFVNGTPQRIDLSVFGGSAGGVLELRIRLVPQNATGNESFTSVPMGNPLVLGPFSEAATNLTLVPRATWSQALSVNVTTAGRFYLRFDLIASGSTVVASNALPIVVQ